MRVVGKGWELRWISVMSKWWEDERKIVGRNEKEDEGEEKEDGKVIGEIEKGGRKEVGEVGVEWIWERISERDLRKIEEVIEVIGEKIGKELEGDVEWKW